MDIGIIVFSYNRSEHLKKVLNGLKKNKYVSRLYIFQDGLKCEKHQNEWKRCISIIKEVEWCKVIYHQSLYNKGLARSIVDGVNIVFEENDAVVVLEDDCVPKPVFIEYMTKCLIKYQDNKNVFSVNGYSSNVDVKANGTDAYFMGRPLAWGWGMWKDRWKLYEQDYKIFTRIQENPEKRRQFNIWGQDLEAYLIGNIKGQCDSWAVFRSLKCIELGGLCPTPYYSLIDNIGFDGTGVHCGTKMPYGVEEARDRFIEQLDTREMILPDKVDFPENYEISFIDLFKWTSAEIKLNCYNEILLRWNRLLQKGISIVKYFEEQNIKNIAIWGRGEICRGLLCELKDKVEIKSIIESIPESKQYENIPVIKPKDITNDVRMIVVIPVYDMERVRQKTNSTYKNSLVGIDEILDYLYENV